MAHRREHFDEWGGCQCDCELCLDTRRAGHPRKKPCICPDCKCGGGAV